MKSFKRKPKKKKVPKDQIPIGHILIDVFPAGAKPPLKITGTIFPADMELEILQKATHMMAMFFMAKAVDGKLDLHGNVILEKDANDELFEKVLDGDDLKTA